MPPIRSLASIYCVLLATLISLNSKIISLYSCCIKEGLVYIIIITPSNYQPSFYLEYTKVNTCFSYNIYLVSNNKYIFILFSNTYNLSQLLSKNTW